MSRFVNFIKNTFAIVGIINTASAIKYLVEQYNEKSEKDKLLETLNEKIKYVENVTQRIDHIQYTLSELKNILDDRNKSESCAFYDEKFDDELFY
jgi:DNA-binding transcriptional regulator GbsR (MarR family)